ncbi:hypothetical protein ACLI4R_17520 [Natrialbaceae archaeon A-chndr2]
MTTPQTDEWIKARLHQSLRSTTETRRHAEDLDDVPPAVVDEIDAATRNLKVALVALDYPDPAEALGELEDTGRLSP